MSSFKPLASLEEIGGPESSSWLLASLEAIDGPDSSSWLLASLEAIFGPLSFFILTPNDPDYSRLGSCDLGRP